jgi:hypothetical protein
MHRYWYKHGYALPGFGQAQVPEGEECRAQLHNLYSLPFPPSLVPLLPGAKHLRAH